MIDDVAGVGVRPTKTIVFAWNYRNWGGAQVYFASLIPKVKEHFVVKVAFPKDSATQIEEKFRSLGIEVILLDDQADIRYQKSFTSKLLQHFRKLRAEHSFVKQLSSCFDPKNTALHVDLGFWSSLHVFLGLARRFHVFHTVHTPLEAKSAVRHLVWKLKGRIAGRLKKLHFLASNRRAKESLLIYAAGVKEHHVKIAYSGVNWDEIEAVLMARASRSEIRKSIGCTDNDLLIVLVGQFIERKGASVLIDALPKLFERVPNAKVVWLTMKSPDGELAVRAAYANQMFSFQVRLGDEVGGRFGVLSIQRAADIFLIPSLEEGLPIALVEAMALGVPCVAANVGAVHEAIHDHVTGILIKANDGDAIVEAVFELVGDPEIRKFLCSNAVSRAHDVFDNRIAAETTIREYKRHFGER